MKKYLFAYAVLATALLFFTCRHYRAENRRLVENQTALAADVTRYRTQLGAEAASVQALRLRCGEFETLRAADAEQIRRLGIRLRRPEAAAKAVAVTDAEIRTPLRDTVVVRIHDTLPVRDTVRMFRWRDPWISVEGRIGRDSAACRDIFLKSRSEQLSNAEIAAEMHISVKTVEAQMSKALRRLRGLLHKE